MKKIKTYYNQSGNYGISRVRLDKIMELAGQIRGKKILDIGCSDGRLGQYLASQGAIVHGCDISEKAVLKAKKVLAKAFVFDVECDNWDEFEKNYDLVIATEVIEHLFCPEKFLNNIKNIVPPTGEIIITTPNFLMWTFRLRMLGGQFDYTDSGFWDRGHVHFFTYFSLKKMIQADGFTIVQENHIIHPKIPNWLGKIRPSLFVYQIIFKIKYFA